MDKNIDYLAIDIGTRSVMGLYGHIDGDRIIIKSAAKEFHKKRAMFDGQVHDIQAVAEVVADIKQIIEEEIGKKIENVAVAAAGRSLITIASNCELKFEEDQEITAKDIRQIDIMGLEEAGRALAQKIDNSSYYYNVGHTVMTYKVDDMELKNPLGHRGKRLGLEIIATFLPKSVVDALTAVTAESGLNISYLTLEPIAAMEVAVPENVRLLNIAMVDIGAGTSDIAVTKGGLIAGYAMTQTAGDEITEAISEKYLLDFNTAEAIKCELFNTEEVEFTDIVGLKTTLSTSELIDSIADSIELVAKNISEAIINANGKAPSAVFLIGGGSQIPTLKERVAQNLGIAENRVAIKDVSMIDNIECDSQLLTGSESVTPVGILASCCQNDKENFIHVYVNDEKIRLFRSPRLKIADGLLQAGFNPEDLIGKKGKSLLVEINGQKKVFHGQYGKEADITLNGAKASIDAVLADGDSIKIEPAKQGEDANIRLSQILKNYTVTVNGLLYPLVMDVKLNDIHIKSFEVPLENADTVTFTLIDTLEGLAEEYEFSKDAVFTLNTDPVSINTFVRPGDDIKVKERNILSEEESGENYEIEKKNIENVKPIPVIAKNNEEKKIVSVIEVTVNGEKINMQKPGGNFIFVDIFNYIDFDRSKVNGKLITKINGEDVMSYNIKINDKDDIEIYWNQN